MITCLLCICIGMMLQQGILYFLYADQPDFLDVPRLYEIGFPCKVSVETG